MNSLNRKIAEEVQSYVDKHKKFPASIKVDGKSYNYGTFTEILADTVVNTASKYNGKVYNNAPAPVGDIIKAEVNKNDYTRMAREVVAFYINHKRCPNYVLYKNQKVRPKQFTYCFAKIVNFTAKNQRYPSSCKFENVFMASTPKTESTDEVFNYFVKTFGKVSTIDEALQKVKEHGYSYYYDDVYNNRQCIDRMKAKKGINCTDSCQVFYHIAKELGYSVNVLHVYCTGSGGGHVRLQLKHSKHTSGKWINRDPACVLSQNGKPLTDIWCGNGKLLATNPSWFMAAVNR